MIKKILIAIGIWAVIVIDTVLIIKIFRTSSNETSSISSNNYINNTSVYQQNLIPRFGINYIYHGMDKYQERFGGTTQEYVFHQNKKLVSIGTVWVRSAGTGDPTSLGWNMIEPKEGVFDFSLYDTRLKDLEMRELWTLGGIDFNTSSIPDYAKAINSYGFDDQKYLTYINKIVERYDGDGKDDMLGLSNPIKYWEVGNEPGAQSFPHSAQDYSHILKISYQNIKANCPDCQVLIGGLAIGQLREEDKWQKALDNLRQMLADDAGSYFDIFNYHEYTDDCDFLTYYHVKGFNELLDSYGFTKPIWITEANTKLQKKGKGKYEDLEVKHTIEEQAQDIIKRAVVAFDAGVDVFFWHRLDDVSSKAFGVGLFDENDKTKPVYYNQKLMVDKIGDFNSVERIDLGNKELYFYKFNIRNEDVFVLWTEGNETILDLSQYFQSSNLQFTWAITQLEQINPKIEAVAKNKVRITKTPVFITEGR